MAGACTIVVTLGEAPGPNTVVQVDLDKGRLQDTPAGGVERVEIRLRGPLEARDVIRVRRVDLPEAPGDAWADTRAVMAGDGSQDCESPSGPAQNVDERLPFDAFAYLGYAVDNFAPGLVGGYAADAADGSSRKRYIAGVDFEFRVAGRGDRQLWIFGETLNGVRSADVDCGVENKPVVCGSLLDKQPEQFRYILVKATSKEAFVGARLELLRLHENTDFPTRFYVAGRLGVMMLSGTVQGAEALKVQEAYQAHHVGTGLLIESGPFGGSYFEVGWGKTELFSAIERPDPKKPGVTNLTPWRRVKIDAFLSFPLPGTSSDRWPRPFMQLYADFDPTDKAADSMQSFFGVDIDLGALFQ